jgi:hypothetical protein
MPQSIMPKSIINGAQQLADRYVAVWNETDPAVRRRTIEQLWTEDGQHHAAARQAIGFAALEDRVTRSHDKNVGDLGYRFRAVQDARRLHDAVTFHWQMLSSDSETVLASGMMFLIVNDQERIRIDYQFVLS